MSDSVDFSRVHLMPREGDQLLVMDRLSGRWAYLPKQEEPFLQLLGTPNGMIESCSRDVAERVAALRKMLVELRIGTVGAEKRFGGLNTIILKLTNACNLACAYCYDFEKIEKATRLEIGLAQKAMDQGLALCEGTLCIILHGGEPMLVWPFIEQIVLEGEVLAQKHKVELRFTGQTNMTRLTQRAVDFSIQHDVTWGVSLDGIPAVHDRFRTGHDGTGSFDMFLQALKKWPDFVRKSSVMTTVTAANDNLLLEAARYFRDLGMAGWDWSLFQAIGRGRNGNQFHIDIGRLCESWDQLFDAVIAGEFDGFPVQPIKKYLDNFLHGPAGNMCLRPQCGAARDLLSISANGTIEACDCIDPQGPLAGLGHLANTTLAAARASPVAEAIRGRDMSNHPQCGSCVWYGVCGGTCLAHAGRLDAVWQDACAVALLAFDRISNTLANSTALQRYIASLPGNRSIMFEPEHQ
jgi:uncharacterized protein